MAASLLQVPKVACAGLRRARALQVVPLHTQSTSALVFRQEQEKCAVPKFWDPTWTSLIREERL